MYVEDLFELHDAIQVCVHAGQFKNEVIVIVVMMIFSQPTPDSMWFTYTNTTHLSISLNPEPEES